MAYEAPYIDESGLHISAYADILADMVDEVKAIYGSDIYLANDSADYQMLSIFARKAYDTSLALQMVFNNRSPVSSVGTGLSSIVKLNGLTRKVPSYSTVYVTLTGASGTVITNGSIQDTSGHLWSLPSSVTIGAGGTSTVLATCQTIGAISATAGALTTINTPTLGWTSVTNAGAATVGDAVELDSTLRSRQARSVAYPSQTRLAGTNSGLAQLSSVIRYRCYENDTGSAATDPNGLNLPGHSITCVVEGGTDAEVANAIWLNRGIGCFTNGDVTVTVTDETFGGDTDISFFRAIATPIYVAIALTPYTGYTSATESSIKTAVSDFINSLMIYEPVSVLTGIAGAIANVNPDLADLAFSVQSIAAGTSPSPTGSSDIAMGYKQVAECTEAYVTISEV